MLTGGLSQVFSMSNCSVVWSFCFFRDGESGFFCLFCFFGLVGFVFVFVCLFL